MAIRIYAVLLGLGVLVAGVLVFGESPRISPGPLSDTHADLGVNCRACHEPFQAVSSGCESCHGALPHANAHGRAGIGCAECHPEHRGRDASLVADARTQCKSCHAHSSIAAVSTHAVQGSMQRFVDPGSRQRARDSAFRKFSHKQHFKEMDVVGAPNCKTCHFVGETAEATRGGEQLVRWSGCKDCHDDWDEAGFEKVMGSGMVVLDLERFPRVAFSHTGAHLETDCETCHTGMRDAEEVGTAVPTQSTVTRLATCFGCHAHQPQGVAWPLLPQELAATDTKGGADAKGTGPQAKSASAHESGSVVACVKCHELHGKGIEADFAGDPKDEQRPDAWDVWRRTRELTFTPWLALFLGLGGTSWMVAWRRLPARRRDGGAANPDVAPQRVPEVPVLSPHYETSVSGLYIIGELAGVPLVNRAMKSGFDVVDFIANRVGKDQARGKGEGTADETPPEERMLDLLIAGSGPAGLGAATRAQSLGLSYVVCEKSTAAATIRDYPRAKIIQAAPVDIPDYGSFFQEDDESKDALVRRWEDIISRTGVVMREREEVVDIQSHPEGGFEVEVQGGKKYRTRHVVLAIGMRGTPRRLRVDGETPERVAYNLIDASEYREQDILVVGGGNAAVEAALALSQPELLNRVTLSHRGTVLSGITPKNSSDIDAAAAEGQLEIVASSQMGEIRETTAVLKTPDGEREIANVMVFALIGAELPIGFLRKVGVKMARKGGI